ncbi:MAG: hypothetical protein DSO02_03520 [Hadesarchaea archaeon]|nr:MAG: hypothetical protein DSO02_03520 [Hadesarchaea archaeon]
MDPARKVETPFHFYSGMDRPLGIQAQSLLEFLEAVKRVGTDSLEFHLYRGDFERWIKDVFNSAFLHSRISALRRDGVKGEELRRRLVGVLEEWIGFYLYKRP